MRWRRKIEMPTVSGVIDVIDDYKGIAVRGARVIGMEFTKDRQSKAYWIEGKRRLCRVEAGAVTAFRPDPLAQPPEQVPTHVVVVESRNWRTGEPKHTRTYPVLDLVTDPSSGGLIGYRVKGRSSNVLPTEVVDRWYMEPGSRVWHEWNDRNPDYDPPSAALNEDPARHPFVYPAPPPGVAPSRKPDRITAERRHDVGPETFEVLAMDCTGPGGAFVGYRCRDADGRVGLVRPERVVSIEYDEPTVVTGPHEPERAPTHIVAITGRSPDGTATNFATYKVIDVLLDAPAGRAVVAYRCRNDGAEGGLPKYIHPEDVAERWFLHEPETWGPEASSDAAPQDAKPGYAGAMTDTTYSTTTATESTHVVRATTSAVTGHTGSNLTVSVQDSSAIMPGGIEVSVTSPPGVPTYTLLSAKGEGPIHEQYARALAAALTEHFGIKDVDRHLRPGRIESIATPAADPDYVAEEVADVLRERGLNVTLIDPGVVTRPMPYPVTVKRYPEQIDVSVETPPGVTLGAARLGEGGDGALRPDYARSLYLALHALYLSEGTAEGEGPSAAADVIRRAKDEAREARRQRDEEAARADGLDGDLRAAWSSRDLAIAERDAARREAQENAREHDKRRDERDEARRQRDDAREALAQTDRMLQTERKERGRLSAELAETRRERNAAMSQARESAQSSIDAIAAERDAARRERDEVRAMLANEQDAYDAAQTALAEAKATRPRPPKPRDFHGTPKVSRGHQIVAGVVEGVTTVGAPADHVRVTIDVPKIKQVVLGDEPADQTKGDQS